MSTTPWIKATASEPNISCVQQRGHDGLIEVRDSKDPSGPILRFTHPEFAAWLDGVRKGEFDHLVDG